MKNPDELRPVFIGDLIELGLIRVNPETETATGNARYIPTGNTDPALARRLEGLHLAAQSARVTLPPGSKEAQEKQRALEALFEAYPRLPSADEVVTRVRNAVKNEMFLRESTRDKYWWVVNALLGLLICANLFAGWNYSASWHRWGKEVERLRHEVAVVKEAPSSPAKLQLQNPTPKE